MKPFWRDDYKDFYDEFWLPNSTCLGDVKDTKYLTQLLEPSDTPPPDLTYCRKIRIHSLFQNIAKFATLSNDVRS